MRRPTRELLEFLAFRIGLAIGELYVLARAAGNRRACGDRYGRRLVTTREKATMHMTINGHVLDIHEAAPALELGSAGVAFYFRAPDTGRLYTVALPLDELANMARVTVPQPHNPASGPVGSSAASAAAGGEEGQGGAPAAEDLS